MDAMLSGGRPIRPISPMMSQLVFNPEVRSLVLQRLFVLLMNGCKCCHNLTLGRASGAGAAAGEVVEAKSGGGGARDGEGRGGGHDNKGAAVMTVSCCRLRN